MADLSHAATCSEETRRTGQQLLLFCSRFHVLIPYARLHCGVHQGHLFTTVMLMWCVYRAVAKESAAKPHMLGKMLLPHGSMFLPFIYLDLCFIYISVPQHDTVVYVRFVLYCTLETVINAKLYL